MGCAPSTATRHGILTPRNKYNAAPPPTTKKITLETLLQIEHEILQQRRLRKTSPRSVSTSVSIPSGYTSPPNDSSSLTRCDEVQPFTLEDEDGDGGRPTPRSGTMDPETIRKLIHIGVEVRPPSAPQQEDDNESNSDEQDDGLHHGQGPQAPPYRPSTAPWSSTNNDTTTTAPARSFFHVSSASSAAKYKTLAESSLYVIDCEEDESMGSITASTISLSSIGVAL
eukprot:PhF_6_TR19963/c0_g1_i2/m.29102